MVALTLLVVIFSLVTTTLQGARIQRLDLTPNRAGRTVSCTTKNNMQGVCVHESVCNEEHTILPGGVIDDSDFREKRPCASQGDWCCTSGVIPHPQIGAAHSDKCIAPENDVCPWCVLLYNVVDVKPIAHRPFCLGALIGSKVIITASTCLLAAQKKMLYAQVPNSANPGKNYTIIRRQFHPDYNSGSHEYDFGIVVMENDVAFDKGKSRGACIDFQKPLEGDCLGYGFDSNGKITSTILKVKRSSCSKNGSSIDAACGVNVDSVCIVAQGGPVLCPKNSRDLYLVGLARGVCNNDDQVTLGGISHSMKWIEEELELMNISKDVYT
ncbi:uncharacterized protein LOC123865353 [Maniola jurtina]|uniref:uncharacterized protein LOC123865353 n=1 Tax=Maniola jurtina TaxID=191418 RepID=UPI001E68B098|nr:uncharacterized protein LOC123865353 [Maniola jurtina]XP_045762297.1 uncharacterized protein LOC123865353 [Maniola jurtina]XP_045762298.1 uncharacterized protein LOC123865353 [Maniola jurtina]